MTTATTATFTRSTLIRSKDKRFFATIGDSFAVVKMTKKSALLDMSAKGVENQWVGLNAIEII